MCKIYQTGKLLCGCNHANICIDLQPAHFSSDAKNCKQADLLIINILKFKILKLNDSVLYFED